MLRPHPDALDRRTFLALTAAGAGAAAFGALPIAGDDAVPITDGTEHARANHPQPDIAQPNIVLITADDLGYGDLSGYGRADYLTPVLDRLAVEGTRFTQAYAIAPVCTPTRVGLMTGRYPARHPIGLHEPLTLSGEDREIGLAPSQPTLASLLKSAGYTTGLFGKWHLGVAPAFHPNLHGFDEFFGPLSGVVDYVDHEDPTGALDLQRNGEPVRVEGYLTDLIADEAVKFIRARREPFFLNHQGTAPHSPWQRRGDAPLTAPHDGPFDVGPSDRYPDMVRALDDAVGRILAALEETGVAERTLVIFTSDNGGKQYASMGGLARGKLQLWEGGIRVPAFARWPGVIRAGITTTQVASTLDWTATMLAAAGVAFPASLPGDGADLLPVMTGDAPPHAHRVFWRTSQRTRQAA
ncbi:MAG: sulfatase-like hydrolase/transferase, partial [Longimicrobiales bacterium]